MPLLALLVTAVLVFPVTIQRQGSDVIYFTAMKVAGPPAWLALPVIFLLVAVILAGPAELVGRCFGGLPPLDRLPLRPDRLAARHRRLHR